VALLAPVDVLGVTVGRASLKNYDEVKRLGIRIGDVVELTRGGDVIPDILKVVTHGDGESITQPTACPKCDGEAGRIKKVGGDLGALTYCLNPECEAKVSGAIKRWVKTANMIGVGEEIIDKACEHGVLADPADLYRVTEEQLAAVPFGRSTFGPTRAKKVLAVINGKRRVRLRTFIDGLGVRGLGEGVVDNVREKAPGQFDTIGDWLSGRMLAMADQIGLTNTAERYHGGLVARAGLVQKLADSGVEIAADPVAGDKPAATYVFCLTGGFPDQKKVYYAQIEAAGCEWRDDVKDDVTHVVVHERVAAATGKAAKALKRGLPLIDLQEMLALISNPCKAPEVDALVASASPTHQVAGACLVAIEQGKMEFPQIGSGVGVGKPDAMDEEFSEYP
jgi:DNA ligase (NAD+)